LFVFGFLVFWFFVCLFVLFQSRGESAIFSIDLERSAFITSLSKFTVLESIRLKQKRGEGARDFLNERSAFIFSVKIDLNKLFVYFVLAYFCINMR
jgi:hypothetical protein